MTPASPRTLAERFASEQPRPANQPCLMVRFTRLGERSFRCPYAYLMDMDNFDNQELLVTFATREVLIRGWRLDVLERLLASHVVDEVAEVDHALMSDASREKAAAADSYVIEAIRTRKIGETGWDDVDPRL